MVYEQNTGRIVITTAVITKLIDVVQQNPEPIVGLLLVALLGLLVALFGVLLWRSLDSPRKTGRRKTKTTRSLLNQILS